MTFLIKKINKNDIPAMVKIIYQAMTDDFDVYPIKARSAWRRIFKPKYFQDFLKEKKNVYFGAYHNDELIGIFGLKHDFGGIMFADWLAVKKEFRNQGVATALLKRAEEWMLKNKYHCYYLFTETKNNIAFYKKRGFRYVGTFKKFWFGQNEVTMQKNLRTEPFEEVFA